MYMGSIDGWMDIYIDADMSVCAWTNELFTEYIFFLLFFFALSYNSILIANKDYILCMHVRSYVLFFTMFQVRGPTGCMVSLNVKYK